MPDYTIGVVEDAIEVLNAFLNGDEGLTLAEVTTRTNLVKNKAFRILSTLEKHRLVQRDAAGVYRLGVRFLSFGERVRDQVDLLRASAPVMDWLAAETEESIFLGVIDGQEALCIDARESTRSIRLFARVGRRAPLYVGGVPKVLLAYLPDEERKALLSEIEFESFTPYTVRDSAALEAILCEIREQGYIVTADDLDVGAHSVAAPLFDYTGRVVAAISIAGPSNRFDDEVIERYVELVQEGANRISVMLGHQANGAQPVSLSSSRGH